MYVCTARVGKYKPKLIYDHSGRGNNGLGRKSPLEFNETKPDVTDDAIQDDEHEQHAGAVGYRQRRVVVAVEGQNLVTV